LCQMGFLTIGANCSCHVANTNELLRLLPYDFDLCVSTWRGGVSTLMSCVCVCAVVGPSRRGGAQLCALFLRHVRLRDLAVGQPHRAGTDTNLRRHGARCHHLHGENLGHYQAGDDEALPRSTDRLQQTRQLRLGTLRL